MIEIEEDIQRSYVEEPPPFGKKWSRLYAIVIVSHVAVIILLYIITYLLS